MEIECQYCNKTFVSKSNLNTHLKNAKYCITQRNSKIDDIYKCNNCDKIYSTKQRLLNHIEKCYNTNSYKKTQDLESKLQEKDILLNQKDIYIQDLKQQLKDLQDRNQELALRAIEKPSSTNINHNLKTDNHSISNTYNHLQPINLSHEHLYQVFDKNLKLEHIYQGQRGLAQIVANNILTDESGKPMAFCNDKSRQIIKYKNQGGEIVKDTKAYNLVSSIAPVAEEIAIKRKREFESRHFKKEEKEGEKKEQEDEDSDDDYFEFVDENGDFFGFEDQELDKRIVEANDEKDLDKKKVKVQNIIDQIETWDEDKKDYYYNKLIKGITNLQILNVNSNIFSKQLSMILPSEN